MQRKCFLCFVCLIFVFLLASCSDPEETPMDILELPNNRYSENSGSPEETKSDEISSGLVFEVTPDLDVTLLSGKLTFTISNARIVKNASQLENLDGLFDSIVPIYDQDGEHIYKYNSNKWPSFILEDGSFVDGMQVILVDVSVHSDNAHMRTVKDTDENGMYAGNYDDPYVFRADGNPNLVDLSGKVANTDSASLFSDEVGYGSYKTWNPGYFSKSGDRPEHRAAYYLMPGETIEYTVGYLVGNKNDGSDYDISNLYLTVNFAKYAEDDFPSVDKTYYIKLDLGE